MAVGLRVRDPETGDLRLDTTYRMARVLGIFTTKQLSGSRWDNGLTQGDLFFRVGLVNDTDPSDYPYTNFLARLPYYSVTKSGTSLYWDVGLDALPATQSLQILYGVY